MILLDLEKNENISTFFDFLLNYEKEILMKISF